MALSQGRSPVYFHLRTLLRQAHSPDEIDAIFALAERLEKQEGLLNFVEEYLFYSPAEHHRLSEIVKMADWQKDHPSWWAGRVEMRFQAMSDQIRSHLTNETLRNIYDVRVGIHKGTYHFVKDGVEGLYGLIEFVVKHHPDTRTLDNAITLVRLAGIYAMVAGFGTRELQNLILQKLQLMATTMVDSLCNYFRHKYESAEKEGKADELLAQWATQGMLELASLVIGVVKGTRASALVNDNSDALDRIARAAGDVGHNLAAEKAAVELLTEAPGAAAKHSDTGLAKALASLKEEQTVVTRWQAARMKYAGKLTREDIAFLHSKLDGPSIQRLRAMPPAIRERLERSLFHFGESKTVRGGSRVGWKKLLDMKNNRQLVRYLDEARVMLEKINNEGIELYTVTPKRHLSAVEGYQAKLARSKSKSVTTHYETALKGESYRNYIIHDYGKNNRFGSGRYMGNTKETALREVFLDDYLPSGEIRASALAKEEYVLIKARYRPLFKHSNFLIYPSFASRRGGICVADLDHVDWTAVETVIEAITLK